MYVFVAKLNLTELCCTVVQYCTVGVKLLYFFGSNTYIVLKHQCRISSFSDPIRPPSPLPATLPHLFTGLDIEGCLGKVIKFNRISLNSIASGALFSPRFPIARTSWALLQDFYHDPRVLDVVRPHLAAACIAVALDTYGIQVPFTSETEWYKV